MTSKQYLTAPVAEYFTTADIAGKIKATIAQVQALIKSGHLRAVNISTGQKARWRIAAEAFEDFLRERRNSSMPVATRQRRRKAEAPAVDFFKK
jgi:hypothetical protein